MLNLVTVLLHGMKLVQNGKTQASNKLGEVVSSN